MGAKKGDNCDNTWGIGDQPFGSGKHADGLEIGLVQNLREGVGGRGLTDHWKAIYLVFLTDIDDTES